MVHKQLLLAKGIMAESICACSVSVTNRIMPPVRCPPLGLGVSNALLRHDHRSATPKSCGAAEICGAKRIVEDMVLLAGLMSASCISDVPCPEMCSVPRLDRAAAQIREADQMVGEMMLQPISVCEPLPPVPNASAFDNSHFMESLSSQFRPTLDTQSAVQIREANQMVEEMMLLANVTVAEFILRAFPSCALLRRHPTPTERQFDPLLRAAAATGAHIEVSSSKVQQYRKTRPLSVSCIHTHMHSSRPPGYSEVSPQAVRAQEQWPI